MDLQLTGRCAIVTGGSRGIGKAIARTLAQEGCDVAIIGRDKAAADETAAEIARQTNRRVIAFSADTAKDAPVRAAVAGAAQAFGRLDILVNCAAQPGGQAKPPGLAEVTDEFFFADMNVKVLGYLRCAREVVPHMKRQGWGRIINISGLAALSTGAMVGSMRNVSVAALTKNMADELAGTGIAVTCVHPGLTETEKTPGVIARTAQAQGLSAADVQKQMASRNLARKLITSDEIASVVTFLASPRSVAINGSSIEAGGGTPGVIHY
jgi:NAD(P)-dependent dehydrogenase (short-subunit alcohol dehydrogenase family)